MGIKKGDPVNSDGIEGAFEKMERDFKEMGARLRRLFNGLER